MEEYVTVSVTIPAARVAELYEFAAQLHEVEGYADLEELEDDEEQEAPRVRAAAGFGTATVRRNYWGGDSEYWRPFLNRLAESPDEWVPWTELCEAIGLTPRKASGMLGAAERRCKLRPPYDKSRMNGDTVFCMPESVAQVVLAEAARA